MSGILCLEVSIGGAGVASCTASGTDNAWTGSGTSATITENGPARTITVPTGNPGKLTLNVTLTTPGHMNYSDNGGTFTQFNQNDQITIANGHTLAFKLVNSGSGSSMIGPIVDATTAVTVGNVSLQNTS